MSAELLETRFFIPPLCPGHLPRPELISRLDEGLYRKLTLISGPAGFGKTALVSEWVNNHRDDGSAEDNKQPDFAWLSLDEKENNPVSFLIYLIHALRRGKAPGKLFGEEALSMLQEPGQFPLSGTLTVLLNELSGVDKKTVLILDDYHSLMTPEIDEIIEFLITNLPPELHIVIITREDPNIPLARLRAGDLMTEIRGLDLNFSPEETIEFLSSIDGLSLSASEIEALESRTEGWITGLRLAAFSLRNHSSPSEFIESFTGSHRMVLDYLVEEVFNSLEESTKKFLLETSVLNRLTGPLCDFVTGKTDSGQKLELLDRSNLFIIPLDNDRCWYRYHHLFRDLLHQKVRAEYSGNTGELFLKASKWCSGHGLTDEAIEYALSSENPEDAASVLESNIDALFLRGEYAKMLRWTGEIPASIIREKPLLCLVYSWILFASGRPEESDSYMKAAENLIEAGTNDGGESGNGLRGRLATIQASMSVYRGDMEKTRELADYALEMLDDSDILWRGIAAGVLGDLHGFTGNIHEALKARKLALEISKTASSGHPVIMSSTKVAITLREKGLLDEALNLCLDQIETAGTLGLSGSRVAGWASAVAGEILVEQNKTEEGNRLIAHGVELTEKSQDLSIMGWSYHCLLRALFSSGRFADAGEILAKIRRISIKSAIPPWVNIYAESWQVRIDLAAGNLEKAEAWFSDQPLFAGGDFTNLKQTDFFSVLQYLIAARVLLESGRLEETSLLLDRLLRITADFGRTTREIEVLMLQAMVLELMDEHDRAMAALEKSLIISRRLGFIRSFADEGPRMGRLLYEASIRNIEGDWARRILSAFPVSDLKAPPGRQENTANRVLVEPLSDREIDVLSLMAQGLKNEQIGERLFISFHTVKVHTRNIFSKLDVHNRTEAVAKARSYGIIDL